MRKSNFCGASSILALAMAGGAALLQAGCAEDSEQVGDEVSALAKAPVDEVSEQFDPARAAVIARTKLASVDGVAPRFAPCGTAGDISQSVRFNDAPRNGAANQRSGSSTSCVAPGALQPTDDANYFCWTPGNDGFTWTYLENLRTNVRGWVRDSLLDGNGSSRRCPGL
jgi:hypothetical protein